MSEFTGYIYSITNMLNGHKYIGKTNDIERRWKEHRYGNGGTAILSKAFKKYGLDSFLFEIVAQIPFNNIEELNTVLNQLEMYYISLYDTFNNGYNATAGGEGTSFYHHSEETRRKISQSQIGKTLTEEHKRKCRIANLGKHHTEKARAAITKALLNRDHSIYERMADKRRGVKRDPAVIMKGVLKRRKPILQYDMQGNFIREYEGASMVEKPLRANISSCCKGKLISAKGYIWRYKESEDFPKKISVPNKWESFKKPIVQYNLDGNFVAEYASLADASRVTGFSTSLIWKCLNGINIFCGKYVWRYKEGIASDHIDLPIINHIWKKSIVQYDKSGVKINEYNNITQAATLSNIGITNINNCLYGRSKTAGGFIWKLKEKEEVKNAV